MNLLVLVARDQRLEPTLHPFGAKVLDIQDRRGAVLSEVRSEAATVMTGYPLFLCLKYLQLTP